jgi:hypothetical protein
MVRLSVSGQWAEAFLSGILTDDVVRPSTTGFGDRPFGYFLRPFHILIEIYPLVPFPPSACEGFSDYTQAPLRTPAETCATRALASVSRLIWGPG